jgi:hypothetical protein
MYSKPGEGLGSAHQKKVEMSFRKREPLSNSDGLSPKARKALAEAKAKKEAKQQAKQEAAARRNAAEAMSRIARSTRPPTVAEAVEDHTVNHLGIGRDVT